MTSIVGSRYAFQVVPMASPMMRIRYRSGVAVDPWGFPDWIPYARQVVELPPPPSGFGPDEVRVLDRLTANEVAARTGDPLWTGQPTGSTPAGWCWARPGSPRPVSGPGPVSGPRRIALVPIELHGAFRHLGGVSTDRLPGARGLRGTGGPARIQVTQRLADEALDKVEHRLGYRLPGAYRRFLARTNGGRAYPLAVHPDFGFVVDQPFFGLARPDWLQDLVYANSWFGDRLTADWLAIGYVQGGLIAVRVGGGDAGSIWYYDDDDPRDRDELTAEGVCATLLHRVADDADAFWLALREAPSGLFAVAAERAGDGLARAVALDGAGAYLPPAARAR